MTGKPVASRSSENSRVLKLEAENGLAVFKGLHQPYLAWRKEVFSIVRQIYGRSPTDDLNDLDENNAFWCVFMNVTLQAANQLGRVYVENLRFTKNKLLKSVQESFQMTEKLITVKEEISGLSTIDYKDHTWRWTTLLGDQAIEITNAKTYVFGDSVLCLQSISDQPIEALKNKLKRYLEKSLSQRSESNLWSATGVRVQNIPRIHYIGHSRRDSKNYD